MNRTPLFNSIKFHYSPFGLLMTGISSKAAGKLENKRKFNAGTELNSDFDINHYETNFRSLDPQLGRFWQIDPMADVVFDQSPYSFGNNNPLTFNDPLGLLSDSAHPINMPEVVVESKRTVPKAFKGIINFDNKRPGVIASKNDWPFSLSRDRSNDMVDSWNFGLGNENRIYLPNHRMTKRLKNAYQVNRAKSIFYKTYLTDHKKGISLKGGHIKHPGVFGLPGIILAGTDIVEQFVGGFILDIYVDENAENLLFVLANTTGNYSAGYHIPNDIIRDPNKQTPGGNMNQVYIWQEPISSAGFSDAATQINMDDIMQNARIK